MRAIFCVVLMVLTSSAAAAADQGRGQDKGGQTRANGDTATHASVHVAFGAADIAILREHYGPRYRNLPPGLQKKVARGGELPPGWKKKLEAFPVAIERRLPPLPAGHSRGVIDGHAVIYNARTHVIVDVAVLFQF